jgi:hypothetical protein
MRAYPMVREEECFVAQIAAKHSYLCVKGLIDLPLLIQQSVSHNQAHKHLNLRL